MNRAQTICRLEIDVLQTKHGFDTDVLQTKRGFDIDVLKGDNNFIAPTELKVYPDSRNLFCLMYQ